MNCHRCGDPMVLKRFFDYGGYYWGWKCTRCGGTNDQTALQCHPPKEFPQPEKSQSKRVSLVR